MWSQKLTRSTCLVPRKPILPFFKTKIFHGTVPVSWHQTIHKKKLLSETHYFNLVLSMLTYMGAVMFCLKCVVLMTKRLILGPHPDKIPHLGIIRGRAPCILHTSRSVKILIFYKGTVFSIYLNCMVQKHRNDNKVDLIFGACLYVCHHPPTNFSLFI